MAPDGGDPSEVDGVRNPQHQLLSPRTKHLVRTLFKGPRTADQLTISERLTEAAVYTEIQNARAQGFTIKAIPGPPTTFRFEPKP